MGNKLLIARLVGHCSGLPLETVSTERNILRQAFYEAGTLYTSILSISVQNM